MVLRRFFIYTSSMKRIAGAVRLVGVWVAWTVAGGVLIYPLVFLFSMSSTGESEFRSSFNVTNHEGAVCMSLNEWATDFGGPLGLRRLDYLSHDPTISPGGQHIAAEIRDYIVNGRGQPEMAARLRRGWYQFQYSLPFAYMYVLDGLRSGCWFSASPGPELPY
jgi:hypothetical protein